MKSTFLPAPLWASSSPQVWRSTLERDLRIAGQKTLDPTLVREHMDHQLKIHRDSLFRRAVVTILASLFFQVPALLLAVISGPLFAASLFASIGLALIHDLGFSESRLAWPLLATAIGSGATFCVVAATIFRFDKIEARFASWRTVPYRANNVPGWVRGIAGDARRRCLGTKLFVHELVQNEVVVDPVLEAVCPVTGKSFFLAVWDEKGEPVPLSRV